MNKTILQVPMDKTLKNKAEKAALEQGFSSLQEAVRVFLSGLSQKKVEVSFQEPMILSEKSEKRYGQMTKDFKSNKNIFKAKNITDLVKLLNEDPIS